MASKRDCHFNKSWLQKKECFNWLAVSRLSTEARCSKCDTTFSIAGSGFAQVLQHARGNRHKQLVGISSGQMTLNVAKSGTVTLDTSAGQSLCHDDLVTRAEIVLLLCLVKHNQSFSSNDNLAEVL